MLARKHRLGRVRDFENLKKQGRSRRTRFFSVRYAASDHPEPRIAVVVSTKISKKAVERNKLRRRARSILSKHLHSIPKKTDVAFYANISAKKASFAELSQDLDHFFHA